MSFSEKPLRRIRSASTGTQTQLCLPHKDKASSYHPQASLITITHIREHQNLDAANLLITS
jgi:hypothetical protein